MKLQNIFAYLLSSGSWLHVMKVMNFWCLISGQAVIENVSLKQQIFVDLEKYCSPHCILASNTSTIDLNLIGEKIKSKDRIVGAHFFRWYLVFGNYFFPCYVFLI